MLKNLLAVLAITIVFASTTSAQNKYFLTYYNKAEKLYDAKDYINAKLYYDSALKKNSMHAYSYFKRGLSLYAEENPQAAIKDFNTSIFLDKTNADAYNFRGDTKIILKDTLGGIKDLDTAIYKIQSALFYGSHLLLHR
jgi:tetratricopeptide (TPR) repeat protein